jgi:alkylation response protein AidB-like acyl-CoA dehydrogenase
LAVAVSTKLEPEYEELRRTVAEFARAEIAPVIGDYYEREEFPYPLVARMGELGLFGLPLPEEVGGQGGDYFAFCLALEELARVDSSVAVTLEAAVGLGAMPIWRFGSEEQRQEWLPDLCAGKWLAAFGLTEPGGGSDAGALATTARPEGDEWVLNGTKAFITNSGTDLSAVAIVMAVTGRREDGRKEISALLVPTGLPGFSVSKKYSKVGWSASDTRELSFSDCRVPAANVLGPRGNGYRQALETLDEGRIAVSAIAVGLAQGCVDECLGYVGERETFGHRIGEYQAIQFKLADMATRTHAARLAWYHAASRLLAGEPFKQEAAMAKLVASDAAMVNAREATQIFGGYGYMNETPVGRFYRDAKILEVGEGTSEVLRLLVARGLGLPAPTTGA